MFGLERERIYSDEIYPASLKRILERFAPDFEKKGDIAEVDFYRFVPHVGPESNEELKRYNLVCEHTHLILAAGILLCIEKEEIENWCGGLAKEVNNLGFAGPLSGRRGIRYKPFSQCWRISLKLGKLIDFLRSYPRDLPPVSYDLSEENLQQVLRERREIKWENEKKRNGNHSLAGFFMECFSRSQAGKKTFPFIPRNKGKWFRKESI